MPKLSKKFRVGRRNALKTFSLLGATTALGGLLTPYVRALTSKNVLDVYEVAGSPTYNGVTPGKTLIAVPGEAMEVKLINNLPALHDDCTFNPNNFHGRNTTNLHTHGLHVSPGTDSSGEFDSDNVFISLVPENQAVACSEVCGEDVATHFRWHETDYKFEVPADHPSGTFWYHAHKHGSTAQQVGAGLAGPLIIKDRPGFMPAYIEQAKEKTIMLMNRGIVVTDPNGGGDTNPTLTMRPGEVQRWRIINAQAAGDIFSFLHAQQPGIEMYQIAFDGLTLPRRVKVDQNSVKEPWLNPAALSTGNRTDIMVRIPPETESGRITLALSQNQATNNNGGMGGGMGGGGMGGMGGGGMGMGGGNNNGPSQIVINVSGSPVDHLWSDDDTLPGSGLVPFDDTPLSKRSIAFDGRNHIDGDRYEGSMKQTMKLNTAEEWTVSNDTNGVHAFHIHVNSFFITHINGVELAEDDPLRRWQDTIGLPYRNNRQSGSVTYKTRFETYTGKFVIHCHNLRHEDQGMMQLVEVT